MKHLITFLVFLLASATLFGSSSSATVDVPKGTSWSVDRHCIIQLKQRPDDYFTAGKIVLLVAPVKLGRKLGTFEKDEIGRRGHASLLPRPSEFF
jgi:hypothetical protein